MPDLMTNPGSLLATVQAQPANGPEWLNTIHQQAAESFANLGLPTRSHEDWKYTNLRRVGEMTYTPITAISTHEMPAIDAELIPEACAHLVFIDGIYRPTLSKCLKSGPLQLMSLNEAIEANLPEIKTHLTKIATFEDEAITAINTAMFTDAAVVIVADGHVTETPVHILNILTHTDQPVVVTPRTLVVMGSQSQATVAESCLSPDGTSALVCPVTEVVVGSGSTCKYYRDIREGSGTVHLARTHVHQADRTNTVTTALTASGKVVRNAIYATLDGAGSNAEMLGLTMTRGTEHVDNFLRVDHAKEHCDSREFFKSVLDDQSSVAFCGRIIVREGAQKTDAKQTNMNLLLSGEASVDTRPQLEIFADDVKCTHGATVGQIEDEAIFYLRARGLDEETARSMLIYAFANECLDHVSIASLRKRHEAILLDRIPHGHRLLSDA